VANGQGTGHRGQVRDIGRVWNSFQVLFS
jgi:hypothetical protein